MTFADFFKTINDTKVFDCTRENLVIDIYRAAGSPLAIKSDTVKKWFTRNKVAQPTEYFPQSNIDKAGFIKYFEDKTADSWQILLEAFRTLEDSGVIDCNPADASAFYLSLLKQFYEILGFTWIESPKERMLKIFNQAVKKHNILDFLQNDSANRLLMDLADDVDDFVLKIKNTMREFEDSNEPLLDKIIEFTILIDEYNGFLAFNMQPVLGSDFYVPLPKTNIRAFRQEIESKIRDLGVLYNEIQSNNND
jgi:hypothetical protein